MGEEYDAVEDAYLTGEHLEPEQDDRGVQDPAYRPEHDEALSELLRAVYNLTNLSVAHPDTPDLAVKQVGAVQRVAVAARQFALSVNTLPEGERPIGWKSLVAGERLQAALVQLSDTASEIKTDYGQLVDNRALGRRAGLIEAVNAVSLAIVGGTPESSTPGTGSCFAVCAGEG